MQLKITARNVEQASAELKQLARRVEDLRPVLAEFGIHMIRSVEQTFQAGGRPTAWPPSIRVIKHGGKTLIKSGRGKNSIVANVTGARTLSIGTNVGYMDVQHTGIDRVVQIPEHIRRVRSRDVYRTMAVRTVSGRTIRSRRRISSGITTVRPHPAHMRIPARPFLMAQPEDLEILRGMLEGHLEGKR